MNEIEIVKYFDKYNKKLFIVTLIALLSSVVITICLSLTLVITNNAQCAKEVEQTRLYFETDYDYGTITQTTDVEIKGDE